MQLLFRNHAKKTLSQKKKRGKKQIEPFADQRYETAIKNKNIKCVVLMVPIPVDPEVKVNIGPGNPRL